MSRCLTEESVLLFIERRMSFAELAEVQEHISSCSACLMLLTESAAAHFVAQRSRAAVAETAQGDAVLGPAAQSAWSPPAAFDEFRLLALIGRGAMGVVYLAHDTVLDRLVAIKFIDSIEISASARDRFLVEARAIARLASSNVVTVHRIGEIEGRPYVVSEYVRGRSLDQMEKPQPWRRALELAQGLAAGLGAAHRRGVLHRDIKPANVMLTEDGAIKILDFGLAKLLDDQPGAHLRSQVGSLLERPPPAWAKPGRPDPLLQAMAASPSGSLTQAGVILGTPVYMAPEVWGGDSQAAGRPTDVYSLGALLFELCSGGPPHRAASLVELRDKVLREPAPAVATRAPGIDPGFAQIIDRCLRRDPAERFQSADELLQALGTVGAAPPRGPAGRRVALALAAAAVTAAVVGGAWVALRRPVRPGAMVRLAGGTFVMGNELPEIEAGAAFCAEQDPQGCDKDIFAREQPRRQVQLSPFRMDATEVTNRAFAAWLATLPDLKVEARGDDAWVSAGGAHLINVLPTYNPSYGLRPQDGRVVVVPGYEERPVRQVSWLGAQRYCEARGGRLPTEAEWEFAARGGSERRFPWGHEDPGCDGVVLARRRPLPCAHLPVEVAPVGASAKDRTPEGIYDLGGNVSEWVLDRFVDRYAPCAAPCRDPAVAGSTDGETPRVVRGGSYATVAAFARSAVRSRWRQDRGVRDIGFRCVVPGR